MEDELARLHLDDLENEPVAGQEGDEEEDDDFKFYLVDRVLTDGFVHFPSLRNVLSKLWHPIEGVTITEIEDKRLIFRFYNEVDLRRMLSGTPWFFNRHLLIFYKLVKGEDLLQVPLFYSNFWVQVHDLPTGSMSEGMAR